MSDQYSEYVSLNQLASRANLSPSFLRKQLKNGMPHYKLGRNIRVRLSEFDAWMKQFQSGNGTKTKRLGTIFDEAVAEVQG